LPQTGCIPHCNKYAEALATKGDYCPPKGWINNIWDGQNINITIQKFLSVLLVDECQV